jgi:hypothetical protein
MADELSRIARVFAALVAQEMMRLSEEEERPGVAKAKERHDEEQASYERLMRRLGRR